MACENGDSSPLQAAEDEDEEEKQLADNWLFDKLRTTEAEFDKFLSMPDSFEDEPLESFGGPAFGWNTMLKPMVAGDQ